MSFFPGMFKAAEKGIETWLMQVNSLGDVVIYKLDANGNPTSMVTGNPRDAILTPLKTIYPVCRLKIVDHPDDPIYWGFQTGGLYTWEAVRQSLVRKNGSQIRHNNRSVFDDWGSYLDPYFTGRYWGNPPTLALTPRAVQLDAQKTSASEDQP